MRGEATKVAQCLEKRGHWGLTPGREQLLGGVQSPPGESSRRPGTASGKEHLPEALPRPSLRALRPQIPSFSTPK